MNSSIRFMLFRDYLPLAKRTEKPLLMLAALRHGLLGIITEAGELGDTIKKHTIYEKPLDAANVLEEVGDLLWYVAVIVNNLNVTPRDSRCPSYATFKGGEVLNIGIAHIACAIGKGANELLTESINLREDVVTNALRVGMLLMVESLLDSIEAICFAADINMGDAMHKNIEKLRLRYPDKYTNADAIARADKVDIGSGG